MCYVPNSIASHHLQPSCVPVTLLSRLLSLLHNQITVSTSIAWIRWEVKAAPCPPPESKELACLCHWVIVFPFSGLALRTFGVLLCNINKSQNSTRQGHSLTYRLCKSCLNTGKNTYIVQIIDIPKSLYLSHWVTVNVFTSQFWPLFLSLWIRLIDCHCFPETS